MAGLPMIYREVLTLRFEDEMKIRKSRRLQRSGSNGEVAARRRWNNCVTRSKRGIPGVHGNERARQDSRTAGAGRR